MNSKFLYFKKKTTFQRMVGSFPENLDPLCFIEDSNEIWFMGHYFQAGKETLRVSEMDNTVTISLSDSSFKIVPGESINLSAGEDNSIVISCNALTKIDTNDPLEWKDKKLFHKESGVTAGQYGEAVGQSGANTIKTVRLIIDDYGHIISAETVNDIIRDYVEQRKADSQNVDRQILIAERDVEQDDTNIVRKGKGFTYNNNTGTAKVDNIEIQGEQKASSLVIKKGDLVMQEGTIVGKLQGEVTGTATPKIHSSDSPDYGGASKYLYGHVKLVDTMPSNPSPSSDNQDKNKTDVEAQAASPYLVYNYVQASKIRINGVDANKHTVQLSGQDLNFTEDFTLDNGNLYISWLEL